MRIAIIGRSEILYETLQLLILSGHEISCILTSKETPEYSKSASDFENLSKTINVPFASSAQIESQTKMIKESKSDIAVSINYSGIISEEIINLFPLGILNAHGGDLPRYRGNACQAWAILNGENRIGLCIHRMIGGELDSGDIIKRDYISINCNTKITKIWNWMRRRIPELFAESLNELALNPDFILEHQSEKPEDALRCYPRQPEDGRINWGQTSLEILRLVNASNKPYSGAFCYFDEKKLIIWDAHLVTEVENFCAVPGQITIVGNGFVDVACAEGKIRIFLAEYDGQVSTPNFWIKSIRKRLN
jgi:methionyl-tRNA formyltransferase